MKRYEGGDLMIDGKKVGKVTKVLLDEENLERTLSGRIWKPDPNLQNIPIRTLEGTRIRQHFTNYSMGARVPHSIEIANMEMSHTLHEMFYGKSLEDCPACAEISARTVRELMAMSWARCSFTTRAALEIKE